MNTSPPSHRGPQLLLAAFTLLIVGCVDDMPTVLAHRLALESEKLDLLQHVVDQSSAKDYIKGWEKRFRDRMDDIEERQRKLVDGFQNTDKKTLKTWNDHYAYMQKCIAAKTYPEKQHGDPPIDLPTYYYFYTKESVDLCKAYERQALRLQKTIDNLLAQPGTEEKDVADLRIVADKLSGAKK